MPDNPYITNISGTFFSAVTGTTTVKLISRLSYMNGEPKNINEFFKMAVIDKSIVIVLSYV